MSANEKILTKIKNFIRENYIVALATTDKLRPYVSHLFYISDDGVELYFISKAESVHSWNIARNTSVAGSLYELHKEFTPDSEIVAVQFIGKAGIVTNEKELRKTLELYGARLLGIKVWHDHIDEVLKKNSKWSLYKIVVQKAKLNNTKGRIKPAKYLVVS